MKMAALVLAPQLDTAAAAPLAAALRALVGCDVVLQAGGVTRLGGLCLQVLLAARARWAADGVAWRIDAPAEGLVAALGVFGAGELLQPVGGRA